MNDFREMVIHALSLDDRAPEEFDGLPFVNLTLVTRRNSRKIINRDEIVEAIYSQYDNVVCVLVVPY